MLSSSIEGGIFGEVEVKAASPKKFCINRSSIEGGIFGNEIAQKPGTAGSQRTDSSISGGIFGGGAYETDAAAMPKPVMAKLDIEKMAIAGMVAGTKTPRENFSPFDSQSQPLAPLPSARSNPNVSSVEGGIFGASIPTPTKALNRIDRNKSSIKGGIFG